MTIRVSIGKKVIVRFRMTDRGPSRAALLLATTLPLTSQAVQMNGPTENVGTLTILLSLELSVFRVDLVMLATVDVKWLKSSVGRASGALSVSDRVKRRASYFS